MTSNELIGQVVSNYLRGHASESEETGTARYLLDGFNRNQLIEIARAILADDILSTRVDIKLPMHFIGDTDLPADILTTERTTYFRNCTCTKAILVVASTGDDETQSLKELFPIGSSELFGIPDLWVGIAAAALPLTEEHKKWWSQALKGLLDAKSVSLERYADYVTATGDAILHEGHPILAALGYALPALRIPRDITAFNAFTPKNAGHASKWRKLFSIMIKRRACYLQKQTPTQNQLAEEDLQAAFDRVSDSIPNELHHVIRKFIAARPGWNPEAKALSECEWELVRPIFDGLKREKFNLGDATQEFYSERDPSLLTSDEKDYLDRLSRRKAIDPDEEDEEFYRLHRYELKEDIHLKGKWDKFMYGSPVEAEDFLVGIVECLKSLFDRDQQSTHRALTIVCDRRTPKELKDLSHDAGVYFATRYRGLKELIGKGCRWDVGHLFDFPSLAKQWREKPKPYINRSVARSAIQLKFYLELEVTLSNESTETYPKQLIWRYDPSAVSSEYCSDLERICMHPLLQCRATRELISAKGKYQSVDLRDVRTLLPTYDKDRGSLVPIYKEENDVERFWKDNLRQSLELRLINQDAYEELSSLYQTFINLYSQAIRDFADVGFAGAVLLDQAKAYGSLLNSLCRIAKGDRNRALLLKPLLEIGTARVEGGNATAIVAPWHPLRLAAIAIKAGYVAGLVKHLLTAETVLFGDTRLYFEELHSELEHPFFPEVVLGWDQSRPEILGLNDSYLDYSLHEKPVLSQENQFDTNENPTDSTKNIIELIRSYLALYPHERANLSVVLYNCDSARLPQAVVDNLNEVQEDQQDLRCQVILRHRNGTKLRTLYEKIVESMEADADSFVASEATRDFMARLRIGIMVDQAPPPEAADGPPADIVFLQDVIARHARLEWYLEDAQPVEIESWIPPRWSRRRPAAIDDLKSIVYLCCPVAAKEGWDFLTAITTFLKGDWDGISDRRLLPARQLDFNDPITASIFKETHNLGNWVVNFDELLDRRQLMNQGVKVIRYKQSETQGRNILISSTAPLGLLRNMVLQRAKALDLGISDEEYSELTKRLIDDANEVSGDLVLRAAKRGRNASELIGVVLSRYLIKRELGQPNRFFGWYFLDDYARWLGQREEQIADILCLSPEVDELGRKRLAVVISESKYVEYGSLASKARESQKQLRQTMDRVNKAVFGDPGRLDRDIWLSRFSDMVLSGIQFPANQNLKLSELRRAIREGECEIYLRGYSHVFVSGPLDCPECSETVEVADCPDAYQETFSRAKLRELLLHYLHKTDPAHMRGKDIEKAKWETKLYRPPTERVIALTTSKNKPKTQSPAEKPASAPQGGDTIAAPESDSTRENLGGKEEETERVPQESHGQPTWTWKNVASLLPGSRVAAPADEELAWLKQTENAAKGALQQFQLNSRLISSTLTPNAALLKFQGSATLTVEQVLRRRSEFLTTHRMNLVTVRAEPGIVALSIARPVRRVLTLPELWSRWNPDCTRGNQVLLIGEREENGALLLLSPLKHAPHSLIAGSTGSGKSVLMQNIVLSIAATNTPAQAKILLIDPKMGVDYFGFEGLPHLRSEIVTSPEQSLLILNELVGEMDRRYEVLRTNRTANITELYLKPDATERPEILWVIHDEFAEWMMTEEYKEGVSNVVSRLGVKARAAGIFLVFGAQRPDANVMPMQLRANLGNRLVLRVDSEGTSEIALGEKGAERLLGKGHLAARIEGEEGVITAQVPFVTSAQIEEFVAAIRKEHDAQ
ncbi:MAG: DNA translocase FtsK [Acidobacteria bacterium]|nr:DNA translocase FtsK [Acidobacteriota bacterium]